jgi:hypothetical protein
MPTEKSAAVVPDGQPDVQQDAEHDAPTGRLRSAVNRIVQAMRKDGAVTPGDRAALRRQRPGEPGGPVFWKMAARYLEPADLLPPVASKRRDGAERQWAVVLAAIAELADLHHTGPGHRLGRVLADRKVSEARVLRLLRDVVHQLASSGARVDLTDLANLVTSDGTAWETDVRRSIALDYYRSHGA